MIITKNYCQVYFLLIAPASVFHSVSSCRKARLIILVSSVLMFLNKEITIKAVISQQNLIIYPSPLQERVDTCCFLILTAAKICPDLYLLNLIFEQFVSVLPH